MYTCSEHLPPDNKSSPPPTPKTNKQEQSKLKKGFQEHLNEGPIN